MNFSGYYARLRQGDHWIMLERSWKEAYFPPRLGDEDERLFMAEYIQAVRMPIVWITLIVFILFLVFYCIFRSKFPHGKNWLIIVGITGSCSLFTIFRFWDYAARWGTRIQLLSLHISLGLLIISVSIGVVFSWETLSLADIGITTTTIGSILGAAAVILSYSRTGYAVFLLGWIVPGIAFMISRETFFHTTMALLFLSGLISFMVINIMEHARVRQFFDAQQIIKIEKQKSDSLLLNILPSTIAEELKHYGQATPVKIESATVMFTDFVGFTKISENLSPEEVVAELDKCFSYFDQVTEKYGLEKLKTIGDSFMCAGGVPEANRTHAIDACLAALEVQAFMKQMKEIKHQQGFPYWELRLGINTGPLVAGVVGHKKFAYDVWGDTVNTASRMESSGLAGEINISHSTYDLVQKWFVCEHRGRVSAKNKGEIDMYLLKCIRAEYCIDADGRVPSERMKREYVSVRIGKLL